MAIYKVKPLYDQTIWADERISQLRGLKDKGWGTSWEISFHRYGSNLVSDEDATLLDLLDKNPKAMIGDTDRERVLRFAYLDAKSALSIQLHPTVEYAKKHDNDYGKYEAWYILDVKPGSTLVAGSKTRDINLFKSAIQDQTLEKYLQTYEVKPHDFVYLPAGCVHALGGGILAVEISTNSNTTYRVYDYGRVDSYGKSRELHLDKAFDNLDLSLQPQIGHVPLTDGGKPGVNTFLKTPHFSWTCIDLVGEYVINEITEALYVTVLEDNISIIEPESGNKKVFYKYDHAFLSADTKNAVISGYGRILVGKMG